MKTGAAIGIAAILSGGMVGTAAMYPKSEPARGGGSADLAEVRQEVEDLRQALREMDAARRGAERTAGEALAVAIGLEGRVKATEEEYEQLLGLLGDPATAKKSGGAAPGAASLASAAEGGALASGEPAPTRAVVEEVLADVRAREEQQREVEREKRREEERIRREEQRQAQLTRRVERLTEQLALQPHQVDQVGAILAQADEQNRLLREQFGMGGGRGGRGGPGGGGQEGQPQLSREEIRAQMDLAREQMAAVQVQTQQQLQQVLTADQYQAYEQLQQAGDQQRGPGRGNRGGRGGGGGGGGGGAPGGGGF